MKITLEEKKVRNTFRLVIPQREVITADSFDGSRVIDWSFYEQEIRDEFDLDDAWESTNYYRAHQGDVIDKEFLTLDMEFEKTTILKRRMNDGKVFEG